MTLFDGQGGSYRSRAEWNDRFSHWAAPACVSDGGAIQHAQSKVTDAIAENGWLSDQGVVIEPHGSYQNNTNVGTESDIDLLAVHPILTIDYADDVVRPYADQALGYTYGAAVSEIYTAMRDELSADLSRTFGRANVTLGKKAFNIRGITGTSAEVNVVPCIRYQYVILLPNNNGYHTVEGVAIFSTEGKWTLNFPEQHTVNIFAKCARTSQRFEQVVRIMKGIRTEMTDRGILTIDMPSFLIECLVYRVEDEFFLIQSDDRYSRVQRVARRIQEILANRDTAEHLHEINDLKWLFLPNQTWTYEDALTFANTLVSHIGDA